MPSVQLITLDPAHFHAALVQKEMYPGVSPVVAVYAPLGLDLTEHLTRVARFNQRAEGPTTWELDVHAGPDSLARMISEQQPGGVEGSGHAGKVSRAEDPGLIGEDVEACGDGAFDAFDL